MKGEPDRHERDGRDAAPPGAPGSAAHPAVRRATGSRYGRGADVSSLGPRASDFGDAASRPAAFDRDTFDPATAATWSDARRSRVHTVATGLPVLMLVVGLAVFYRAESVQSQGAPIAAEASAASGEHRGLSTVQGRRTLWFDDTERGRRGVRVTREQALLLQSLLVDGDVLELDLAPTVAGSRVPWVWRVRRGDEVLLDDSARLR